ncbi:hypothetical protein CSAL01_08910 [Colletotrichum salicis]|uniref:Uncharacterized protein n=1 Tax=Colletotrichum salicis TaxID=1209931 RepID=A0A135V2C5_9PEZI|nr:hypothetical protein CSAL01_08910 [Colletotrichum salicis]
MYAEWLISASSHPIDDGEDELVNGILDRIKRQREASGSDLQPGSTAEMSKPIVDYCADSYDRKPNVHESERPEDSRLNNFPSIRQTFSKSINSVLTSAQGRDETNLSDRFSDVTKRLRDRLHGNTKEKQQAVGQAVGKAHENIDEELASYIGEAKELSSSVKDVPDEISMLETIVEYQQDVQKAMKRKYVPNADGKQHILDTEFTATYIINDIKRLCSVAERFHAATVMSFQNRDDDGGPRPGAGASPHKTPRRSTSATDSVGARKRSKTPVGNDNLDLEKGPGDGRGRAAG